MFGNLRLWAYIYIESERSYLEKKIFIALLWALIRITRSPKSLQHLIRHEVHSNELKTVFRRTLWLLKYSWINIEPIKDHYYDISIDLNRRVAEDLCLYINSNKKLSEFNKHIILAQLSASILELELAPGDALVLDTIKLERYDQIFVEHLNGALDVLARFLNKHHLGTKNDNQSDSLKIEGPLKEKESVKKNLNFPVTTKRNSFSLRASHVFFRLLDIFDDIGFSVFAMSGTLLGIIRENNFLAHDIDIDIGIMEKDFQLDILQNIIDQTDDFHISKCDYPSYRLETTEGVVYCRNDHPVLIRIGHKNGIQTDLFIHFNCGENLWHGSSIHGWKNTTFGLGKRTFFGREINVPSDYDLYLTENYGNWRVPVSRFSCSTGTPNISISNSCHSVCYFLKLAYDYYLTDQFEKAGHIISKMLESKQFDFLEDGSLVFMGETVQKDHISSYFSI